MANNKAIEIGDDGSEVIVTQLTDWSLVLDCARMTVGKEGLSKEPSEAFKINILRSEHSPLRALMFKIEMLNIPSFVSVHLVRHKIGVEHFVQSNRPDRNGGNTNVDRNTPVNHCMIINAQELLNMARRRLCGKASPETRKVMNMIKKAIEQIDFILYTFLLPMCIYRGGVCYEDSSCGLSEHWSEV